MADKPVIVVENALKGSTIRAQSDGDFDVIVLNGPPATVTCRILRQDTFNRNHAYVFRLSGHQPEFDTVLTNASRPLYLAFDEDQRGMLWTWLVQGCAATGKRPVLQVALTGLQKNEVSRALSDAIPPAGEEAEDTYLRSLFSESFSRHLLRLLGTAVGPGNLPLTSQSLAALVLIDAREQENGMYARAAKWRVTVSVACGGVESALVCQSGKDGKMRLFVDRDTAQTVADRLAGLTTKVVSVNRQQFSHEPPEPFGLCDFVSEALGRLGLGPKTVLLALRKLYYGVTVDGIRCGLVSNFLPGGASVGSSVCGRLDATVRTEFGEDALSGVAADELAAGAIVPLLPELAVASLADVLDSDELRLYDLIRSRALASRMGAATGERLVAVVSAGQEAQVALHGRVVKQLGFLRCYQDKGDETLHSESDLSALVAGDEVTVTSSAAEETVSFPPEYYSFESLFADLAEYSIGLDPLHFVMLQNMLEAGYLRLTDDGCLRPLKNCGTVVATMNRAFPSMEGLQLLAYLHQTAEEVVSGRKALDFALKQFDQTLTMHGKSLVKVSLSDQLRRRQRRSSSVIKTVEEEAAPRMDAVTPDQSDAAEMASAEESFALEDGDSVSAAREGEAGEAFPVDDEITAEEIGAGAPEAEALPVAEEEVDHAMARPTAEGGGAVGEESAAVAGKQDDVFRNKTPVVSKEEPAARPVVSPGPRPGAGLETRPCPVCQRPMFLTSDQFGRFWNCSGFPSCRYAEKAVDRVEENKETAAEISCPLCGTGAVQPNTTPSGKNFFVCSEPACEFMAWSRPHLLPCGNCSSPFLVEKKDSNGTICLRCPRAGCRFQRPLPGDEDNDSLVDDGAVAPVAKKKVLVRRVSGSSTGDGTGQKRKVRVVRRKK